ncbi:hypothetical protein PVAR5_4009 [Paecilomyces variotii No. 5]|uniref:Uncharacterized protein n=1 Tax=Byssochlamys spectabilis (strain No. 5 / NBRC 109023) TaxID=1356009 RepID=V5G3E7_BYSSN|nr:hypothetical protein PVAR5_4009 [Paecilomyces variotii No. 5]
MEHPLRHLAVQEMVSSRAVRIAYTGIEIHIGWSSRTAAQRSGSMLDTRASISPSSEPKGHKKWRAVQPTANEAQRRGGRRRPMGATASMISAYGAGFVCMANKEMRGSDAPIQYLW